MKQDGGDNCCTSIIIKIWKRFGKILMAIRGYIKCPT